MIPSLTIPGGAQDFSTISTRERADSGDGGDDSELDRRPQLDDPTGREIEEVLHLRRVPLEEDKDPLAPARHRRPTGRTQSLAGDIERRPLGNDAYALRLTCRENVGERDGLHIAVPRGDLHEPLGQFRRRNTISLRYPRDSRGAHREQNDLLV